MYGSKSTTDMVVLFSNRTCSMRRRCQYYFAKPMSKRMRTYVKKNAKPMLRLMRSRRICPTRPALSFGSFNFESRRAENPSRTYRRLLGAIKSLAEAFPWKSIGKPKENNSEIMIKAMTFQNHVKTFGFLL